MLKIFVKNSKSKNLKEFTIGPGSNSTYEIFDMYKSQNLV